MSGGDYWTQMCVPWQGLQLRVSPDPRLYYRLAADVCVPAAFRAEFDAWAERFFSPHPELNVVKDDQAYVLADRIILLNPRAYAALQRATE